MKIAKKSDYASKQNRTPTHTAKTVEDWLDANMSF